jgi:membrane-associated phospholipid phosphatase
MTHGAATPVASGPASWVLRAPFPPAGGRGTLAGVHALDIALFHHVNQGWANPLFDWLMPALSHGNKHWFGILLMVGGWLYVLLRLGSRGRWAAVLLLVAVVLSNELSDLGKHSIESLRPCVELAGARVIGDSLTSQGMPSGHAANTAAAATVLFFSLGRRWWPIWLLPFAVGLSRIYIGVHYPLQVLAGWAVGIAVGLLLVGLWRLLERRGQVEADGAPIRYDDEGGEQR